MSQTKLLLFLPVLLFWCVILQECISVLQLFFKHRQQQNLCHGFNLELFSPIVPSWMWKPHNRKHPLGLHTLCNKLNHNHLGLLPMHSFVLFFSRAAICNDIKAPTPAWPVTQKQWRQRQHGTHDAADGKHKARWPFDFSVRQIPTSSSLKLGSPPIFNYCAHVALAFFSAPTLQRH